MHVAADAVELTRRIGLSQSSRLRMPNVRPGRALSVDSVVADMRAILWPDQRDQVSAEVEPVSTTSAQYKLRLAQDRGVRLPM
jgi:hypothetical protein